MNIKEEIKELQTTSDEAHPNFTIICKKCGSSIVLLHNSLGYSEESGWWGYIDLVCVVCGSSSSVFVP